MSNIDFIHLKMILYLEYSISRTFYRNVTFEKLYLPKKGPHFVGSYATQNKLSQKTICWQQLFRQKWAFFRMSTSVLHKCGHAKAGKSIYSLNFFFPASIFLFTFNPRVKFCLSKQQIQLSSVWSDMKKSWLLSKSIEFLQKMVHFPDFVL